MRASGLQLKQPAGVATHDEPLLSVTDGGGQDLSQLRPGIHQRLVGAKQHTVGAGTLYQLLNDPWRTVSRTGFEVEIRQLSRHVDGLRAMGFDIAGMPGDEIRPWKAGGSQTQSAWFGQLTVVGV
jgi:hypothetical protein